jgi:two-component system, cell cycle sensor histidine kinase and response regulator CckA
MSHILVIDDDPQVLKLTTAFLVQQGYEVLHASDPQRALEILTACTYPVDLFVVDAVLPSMSGPELVESLLSISPSSQVLFITGLDALTMTIAYGKPCETIQKPFSLNVFKDKVAGMLRSQPPNDVPTARRK